ncbi:hypothetical protein [Streptomyces calidiresistens]|uniref:hypothetical protein n=1 Tax=Streptomyces calidiresistens TaxID=1485586 RepID=UPI0015F83210|nr:hypothetical protein [Streptomyces calidiresistens]
MGAVRRTRGDVPTYLRYFRATQWPAALAVDRWDGPEQRDRQGDIVVVAVGGDHGDRDAVRLDGQVVLPQA